MIKKFILLFCSILTIISCTKTEIITIEEELSGIEDHKVPVTELMQSLKMANDGIIISENTVTFTKDYTIPRDSILNFYEKNRFIITENTTLTIDGIIAAGNYQIFEIHETGKITGCPQIEHTNPIWFGVDETGTQPASDLFQIAVEAFPCVKKFVANGKFLVDQEILLNISNRYYDFFGAIFESPTECTNAGGLITVGSRDYRTSENFTVVENITIKGGAYKTNHVLDNVLGVLHSKNITITDININCEIGQRGIALQIPPEEQFFSNAILPTIEDVIVENIIQIGGVNVLNIDLNYGLVKNVLVNNIIGKSITNERWLPVKGSTIHCDIINTKRSEAAIRMSSQGDVLRIKNVSISNIVLDDVYSGFNLVGVNANISNISIDNFAYRGISIQYPDVISFDNIKIHSNSKSSIIGEGVTGGVINVKKSNGLKNIVKYNDITLSGNYKTGFYNAIENNAFNNVELNGAFEKGIWGVSSAANQVYDNIILRGSFDQGIYNQSDNTKFTNSSLKAIFKGYGINNTGEYCNFQNINIETLDNQKSYGAIYNQIQGTYSNFSGIISGDYTVGGVNAAGYSSWDFEISGTFSSHAIFSYGNSKNFVYSSIYKTYIRFLDNQQNHTNDYRDGDTHEIYVYDQISGTYILNPPIN